MSGHSTVPTWLQEIDKQTGYKQPKRPAKKRKPPRWESGGEMVKWHFTLLCPGCHMMHRHDGYAYPVLVCGRCEVPLKLDSKKRFG